MTADQERSDIVKQAVREAFADTFSDADRKRIVKEAISEWLDAKFSAFGKWSFYGICAAALALLAYLLMIKAGWSPPT